MSDKKQRRPPKIVEKWERTVDGDDMNPNKKVHAGHRIVLTSQRSKPEYGCTLPQIGNGKMVKQHTGNIMHAGSGEPVSTHLAPLPLKAVGEQQVKNTGKRSSASGLRMDSQHPQQDRRGFKELPVSPGVVKQDCSNNEGRLLKHRLMPVRLVPVENVTPPGSDMSSVCKLPEIKNAQVQHSRPNTGNLRRLPCVLPPTFDRKEDKNLKLPAIANAQRAECPRADNSKGWEHFLDPT